MTKIQIGCAAIALAAATFGSVAQQLDTETSIVAQLENSADSAGTVAIYQDSLLNQRLGGVCTGSHVQWRENTAYITTKGYRIQVLSDNTQRVAREEATKREELLKEYDANLDTYITFTSPFWRLRAGNYRSYEEANRALLALGRKFPKFRGEMRILEDNIEIPIYTVIPEVPDTTLIDSNIIL